MGNRTGRSPMLRNRAVTSFALVMFVLGMPIAFAPTLAGAGSLSTSASCDASGITVEWTFYEDPQHPVANSDWTGYDVYRRSLTDCGSFARVNPLPIPRT